jgi:protein gp37
MAKTDIQWTWRQLPDGSILPGFSFNPWWGCVKVSHECDHCYAEGTARHYGKDVWGPFADRWFFGEKHWDEPLSWNRKAERLGHRLSVFCASMADVFEVRVIRRGDPALQAHDQVQARMVAEARARLWQLIDTTPWLNWLLLTKRPGNIMKLAPWGLSWPDNVWVGTSAGTQDRADKWLPILLSVPAVVRFVSVEPQLERVTLVRYLPGLQWVICGGESGQQARPFNLDWARTLRDQCQAYHTPFFFKQVGGRYHHSGGRDLDGRTWDELPPERPEEMIA